MTGPSPAARARRQTWTIIGTPAISASGFPGRRVAARREGMTTIGFIGGLIGGTISGGGYFPVWCATRGRPSSGKAARSEEHTSELQSLMRISYAVFCLKKKKIVTHHRR